MNTASVSQFARAQTRQQALTDQEWLRRCDELALQQRVLFLELLTFGRDGATPAQTRCLIDYLSSLHLVAVAVSASASAPVELPEFQAAIKRAGYFFHASTTSDRRHFDRMMRAWFDAVVERNDPVVWACGIETLRQHGIMSSPLMADMVVTIYAIADVFSRRLGNEALSQPARNPNPGA